MALEIKKKKKKKEPAMIKSLTNILCLSFSVCSACIFSAFRNMIIHWWARLTILYKTDDWHLASNMDSSYPHWAACTNADRESDMMLISMQWQQEIRGTNIVMLTSELELTRSRAAFKNLTCLDWWLLFDQSKSSKNNFLSLI